MRKLFSVMRERERKREKEIFCLIIIRKEKCSFISKDNVLLLVKKCITSKSYIVLLHIILYYINVSDETVWNVKLDNTISSLINKSQILYRVQ